MTIKEYQKIIEKTAIYPKEMGVAYCVIGLTGEAGEIANKIKKLYRDYNINDYADDLPFYKWEHTSDEGSWEGDLTGVFNEFKYSLKSELGDVLWYVTALASEFGLSLEEIMETNYAKLIKRRETGTLQGSGDDREEQKLI